MKFTSSGLLLGLSLVLIMGQYSSETFAQDDFLLVKEEVPDTEYMVESQGPSDTRSSKIESVERDYVEYLPSDKSTSEMTKSDISISDLETFGDSMPGDLLGRLQLLQQEVMRLNGILEQQSNDIRLLKEKSLERYIELDRRISENNTSQPFEPQSQTTTVFLSDQSSIPEKPGESEAYRSAYDLVKAKEFEMATTIFHKFLRDFPDGKFAPNAHYWLGELYLVLEPLDLEASRQSFMLLVTQFPKHAKVPDALFKLGKIQLMKGNRERAKHYLNRVLLEFSDSNKSVLKLAQDFIDQNNL